MHIIDGKILAEKVKDEVVKEIIKLNGDRPNLAIILVGNREDSELYVSLKEKEAKKVGIDTHLYKCDSDMSEKDLLATIEFLNKDDEVDAILLQLPLPKNFDTDKVIAAIDPKKDVDRFHPDNLKILMETCSHAEVMPPVFDVVLEILNSIKYDLNEESVCVLANSDIFGQGLKKVLECRGAHVVIADALDKKISEKTLSANILITALGRPEFVKGDMIKNGAVVIDIGITKKDKKVYGDVLFKEGIEKASFITPVPGGVGPLTIAMAFKNTLSLYKRKHNLK